MLGVTYTLLCTAMGLCAGCHDWHKLSERAVELSSSSGGGNASTNTQTGGGGLAAADSYALEAAKAAEPEVEQPTTVA